MSIPNKIRFFWLGTVPTDPYHILGTLLVAKRTAVQIDPSIHQVLVRGLVHGYSKSRRTGKRKDWPLHYTMDFKNPVLEQQHKHYTAHANVNLTPLDATHLKNWFDTVPSPMLEEDDKTLLTLPDEFYSEDIKAIINRWNPQDQAPLKEFRPEDIAGSDIGPDFLTYGLEMLNNLDQKRRDLIQEELEWYLKEEAARLEKEAKK